MDTVIDYIGTDKLKTSIFRLDMIDDFGEIMFHPYRCGHKKNNRFSFTATYIEDENNKSKESYYRFGPAIICTYNHDNKSFGQPKSNFEFVENHINFLPWKE